MIAINKGLYKDCNEQEQPVGTWREATNLVWDKSKRVLHTEYGSESFGTMPSKTLVGHVNIDDDMFFFFASDEIGVIESNSNLYRAILTDSDLNFSANYAVKVKALKNAKGQRILIFTDDYNAPRFLNIDDINNTGFSDKLNRLMPLASDTIPSDFTYSVEEGGQLTVGSYIVFYRFVTSAGQRTNFEFLPRSIDITQSITPGISSLEVYRGSFLGANSGKQIILTGTGIDTDYDYVQFGLIGTTNNGQSVAKIITEQVITGSSMTVLLSDFDRGEDLDLAELLAPKAFYQTAKDLEVMRDEILLLDTKSEFDIGYQKYALDIQLDYFFRLYEPAMEYKYGEPNSGGSVAGRGFMPGEVYAFYIVFLLKDGSYSKAYHIAGRDAVGTDTSSNTTFSSKGKRFHINDTADGSGADTTMGYWENVDELYPSTPDFNSNGGRDLRGEPVKHHRFPSLQHLHDTHYDYTITQSTISFSGSVITTTGTGFSAFLKGQRITVSGSASNDGTYTVASDSSTTQITVEESFTLETAGASITISNEPSGFGNTGLPILGINASNVVIPSHIADLVKGWQICYAKRTIGNSIVLGYGDMQYQGDPNGGDIYDNVKYCANVGNLRSPGPTTRILPSQGTDPAIRFSNYDLLRLKPQINPSYVKYEMTFETLLDTPDPDITSIQSGVDTTDTDKSHSFLFTGGGGSNTTVGKAASNTRNIIKRHEYIPANTITPRVDNRLGNEHLHIELTDGSDTFITGAELLANGGTEYHRTRLISLCQFLLNVYSNFYDQTEFVLTSQFVEVTGAGTQSQDNIRGGDVLLNYLTYTESAPISANTATDNGDLATQTSNDDSTEGLGSLAVKGILCYSVSNLLQRYGDNGDGNTSLYPQDALFSDADSVSELILETYDPLKTTVQYLYDASFNIQNEVNAIIPFNPFEKQTNIHRHRVVRSSKFNRTAINFDIEFLANSFYDMPDDRGDAVGLTAYNDRLLVRHEKTVYITSPKQKVQLSSGVDATIGNNDIFEIEPQELVTTDHGFAGSTSRFNAIRTEWGVVLIDDKAGKVFLYSQNLEEISKIGMENFFEERMTIPEQRYQYYSGSSAGTRWSGNKQVFTVTGIDERFRFNTGDYIYSSTADTSGKIIDIILSDGNVLLYTDLEYGVDTTNTIYVYGKLDNPFHKGGTIAGYDPEVKRLLVTKNDILGYGDDNVYRGFYRTGMSLATGDRVTKEQVYEWNGSSFDAYTPTGNLVTLDFALQDKFWVSEKTYSPEMYVSTQRKLFYIGDVSSPTIARMNIPSSLGDFAGTSYDVTITLIHNENPEIAKAYFDIFWKTLAYNSSEAIQVTQTFDALKLDNSYQARVEDTLTVYVDVNTPNNLRAVKGTWRFNQLKDGSSNHFQDNYLKIKFTDSDPNLLYLYGFGAHFNPIGNI